MKLCMPSLFDVFFPIFPYLQEKEKIIYSTLYCYGMFGYVKRKLKEKKLFPSHASQDHYYPFYASNIIISSKKLKP